MSDPGTGPGLGASSAGTNGAGGRIIPTRLLAVRQIYQGNCEECLVEPAPSQLVWKDYDPHR